MSFPRRWLFGLLTSSFWALLLLPALAPAQPVEFSTRHCAEDFDAMWKAVDEGYAYFGTSRGAWRRTREAWRPRAASSDTRAACARVLAGALSQLRDDHVSLLGDAAASPRSVPAETDIWGRWSDGAAVVTAVRAGSVADVAGLFPGHVISSVQGVAIERVVREQLGNTPNPGGAARDWALRHALAGPRRGAYVIGVRDRGASRLVEIARTEERNGNGPPLIARKIGEQRDLGYLRLKNNLADAGLVAHFDAALLLLKDTRGLILDLRETQAGGSELVARAILGRFVATESAWQVRETRGKARATDTVAPRGPFTYRGPIVVLVDRWTAAEGEALAAGLESAARATLVGTEMAGLRGRNRELALRHSGLRVSFPEERTLLTNGAPRESVRPAVPVDLAAPSGGPGDPILYQGLKQIEALTRK